MWSSWLCTDSPSARPAWCTNLHPCPPSPTPLSLLCKVLQKGKKLSVFRKQHPLVNRLTGKVQLWLPKHQLPLILLALPLTAACTLIISPKCVDFSSAFWAKPPCCTGYLATGFTLIWELLVWIYVTACAKATQLWDGFLFILQLFGFFLIEGNKWGTLQGRGESGGLVDGLIEVPFPWSKTMLMNSCELAPSPAS